MSEMLFHNPFPKKEKKKKGKKKKKKWLDKLEYIYVCIYKSVIKSINMIDKYRSNSLYLKTPTTN